MEQQAAEVRRTPDAVTTEEIHHRIYSCIEEIPTLPAVVPRILAVLEDEDADVDQIAAVISHDPSVTAKILRVANSAYYGFSGEISTLPKAIVLIGLRMVKSLAVSIPLIHAFPGVRAGESGLNPRELWIHSLAVATLLQRLAHRRRHPHPEALFITGILHDVGQLILAHFFPPLFQRALLDVERGVVARLDIAERELFGADHGTVAGILLRRWKFPSNLVAPVACHHSDEIPDDVDRIALAGLRVADHAACRAAFSPSSHEEPELLETDLQELEIEPDDVADLCEYLETHRDGFVSFYEAVG
ncbi:MAG: HDOD domain-containing protein [Acidobacteriota bacterium]